MIDTCSTCDATTTTSALTMPNGHQGNREDQLAAAFTCLPGVTNSPGRVRCIVRQHDNGAILPVTLRVQTCRMCRVVRACDPSGGRVNSAESDSAVRCGEFESSHAPESSLLGRRGIGRSRRAHQAAAGDGSQPGLAAQLLITPTLEQLGGGLASGCNTGTGLTT